MGYEIASLVIAGISAIASVMSAIAAFKAYSICKKYTINQKQEAGDNVTQIQIGEKHGKEEK